MAARVRLLNLLEFAFETLESVQASAVPPQNRQHFPAIEAAHLARIAFHDGVADRDLAGLAHGDMPAAPDREDRRSVRIDLDIVHGISYLRLRARGMRSS